MGKLIHVFWVLLLSSATVGANNRLPGPLVEAGWLLEQGADKAIVVLDVQEPAMFTRHHVPNAVNWPFSQWRSGDDGRPPKSLLPLNDIAERLGDRSQLETRG